MQKVVQSAGSAVQSVDEPDDLDDILDDESISINPNSQPGLSCLADVGSNKRPPYSNFTLVKYAILGSPNQRLTLAEIYDAITDRFPWFVTAGKGWKNSVRHCLSLDTQFYKEPRTPMQPGKGFFWKVSVDTPRGNKRQRKRNRKLTKRELDDAVERSRPRTTFKLTTPAFSDYATTLPGSSTIRPAPSSSAQSGWIPYFPPVAKKSAPAVPPVQQHAEVTSRERTIPQTPKTPSTNPFKLSSASYWEEEFEGDSELESDDGFAH